MTTASSRFYGWQVVTAAVVGAALSPATLVNVPFSLFIPALEAEFHWSRSTITAALSVFLALLVVSLPVAGRLVDRLGARRVALPSVLAYGLALASVALLKPSTAQLYAHYGAIAVLGAGAQSLTFIRVLSTWFERRRGLAIGACMAGFGLGYVLVPLVTQALIAGCGWRVAYAGLGLLALLGALPVIALLLHDSPGALGLPPGDGTEARPEVRGPRSAPPPLVDVLRTREFWLLAAIFVLMSAALNGVQAQLVPLLTDRGISAATAALMLSAIGVGSFPARLLVGFFLDRAFAPYIAAACFGLSALALAWLVEASAPVAIAFVAIAVGLSLGAENDILGYLTGRYFSLACFGRVYGALLAAYLLGAAAGPYAMALARAYAGSYTAALHGGVVAIAIACALLFLLPRYPVGGSRDARTH